MLTVDKVKQKFNINEIHKPSMVIDSSIITAKYHALKNLVDGLELYYSVKTNPHIEVIRLLEKLGSGFEVSSHPEMMELINLGIPANRIIIGNTLKVPKMIEEAHKYGINYFAYDSETEVQKLAKYAPGSNVSLRVSVDNTGSDWPLSKKFGSAMSQALDLLKYAKAHGLNPHGLTFHVGSQCLNPLAWSNALMTIAEVYFQAKRNGIKIEVINMGGGFPSKLIKNIPEMEHIRENINKTIKEIFASEDLKFYIEPGRGLVGQAALMIASVIGKATRGAENWLILDIGVYNGLLEAVAGIEYEFVSDREISGLTHRDDLIPYSIGGPTCDSWDTIVTNYHLPKDLEVGDVIYILNTGAYTVCEATRFNGFDPPKIFFI
ncbi:MAG: type III PLP-dependent enzyme [Candidatus Parcubacteria bacterium]|nr:type III PLP-dependent enzyme [Candidatus Parcubacteria bacterium]